MENALMGLMVGTLFTAISFYTFLLTPTERAIFRESIAHAARAVRGWVLARVVKHG